MAFADAQTGGKVTAHGPIFKITIAGTVSVGDALGYSSGWKRALATVGSVVQGRLVALEDGVSGDVISATGEAIVDGRISGATAGNPIYVAEGSANGQWTETAPSTQNDATTIQGYAISATEIWVRPAARADALAP